MRKRIAPALLLLGISIGLLACGPKKIRVPVLNQDGIQIVLRSEKDDGQITPRGFDHPQAISPVRLAHILSRIDIETTDKQRLRKEGIPLTLVYDMADGLSAAFAAANPDQEIVVMAERIHRRLGVFTQPYLTSFITYMQDDQLVIHLSRTDWRVPLDEQDDRHEPTLGKPVMKFRAIPGPAMALAGGQSLAIDWRDPMFRTPDNLRVLPGGRVQRRTVLMESIEPEELAPEPRPDEPNLSDLPASALRELADLEEARDRGDLNESQYQARRRVILKRAAETP